MDLNYQRMHAICSAKSHPFTKDVPLYFLKCMKAYHFFLVHPKFEVKIPIDGSKPQSKKPHALVSADDKDEDFFAMAASVSLLCTLQKRVDLLEEKPQNAVMQ